MMKPLLQFPVGRCGPAAPTLAEMFKPRMKAKEHEWERRGDRGLLIVDRRISRFFMCLEHLAKVMLGICFFIRDAECPEGQNRAGGKGEIFGKS